VIIVNVGESLSRSLPIDSGGLQAAALSGFGLAVWMLIDQKPPSEDDAKKLGEPKKTRTDA